MKKRDLMNFIDMVEGKAVRSVTERHNKIINDAKEELFAKGGYNERINKIQKQVNSLQIEAQNLVLDLFENKEINYPKYNDYDLLHRLNYHTGKSTIKNKMVQDSKFQGGNIPLLIKAKDLEIKEVKENYAKVKYVSQEKTSAKDIAEYLEAIGFDISSVRKGDDCVALSVEIDKSKLFVCGDNK
jgi:hypothetical protein